ncbi:MAG TPA: branched-chain amino acid ABC transporter permease [Kiloniellales bacterium]|nr:branched-chain amino acid ABC transporter permease [Kiloniellales bacterium]
MARVWQLLLFVLIMAVLIGLPPLLGAGLQNAMTNMLIAALFAMAFNLLMGQGGMLSFGHAAFYGVGAFAVMHLMTAIDRGGLSFPTPLLPLAGAAAGLLVGLVTGWFATLRSGVYFALVTLALAEMLHSLAPHWEGLFGGEAGISSMRMPWGGFIFGQVIEIYYLTLIWVTLSIGLLYAYTRTPFGRLTLALRDNEERVRFMGYDAHATKMIVFAVSATFAGIAGGLLAVSNEQANYELFGTHVSAQVVLHTFVGGSTVFFGPAIGAAIFTLFAYLVSDVSRSWLLYQGVIFVLVMLYAPLGIGGVVMLHLRHWASIPWQRMVGPYAGATAATLLMAIGTVMVVEFLEALFSPHYVAQRRQAETSWPAFERFGASWEPFGILTWGPPLLLLIVGLLILLRLRHRIVALWDEVQETAETAARSGV